MKKVLLVLTVIFILIVQGITYAETVDVIVKIPDYDVRVNGELIDTVHSQYPVIIYKDITYFPMTSDYLSGLGLGLEFSSTEGLKLGKVDKVGKLEQKFLGAINRTNGRHVARLSPFAVEVNGKTIINSEEEYPVLVFKNITYFPMTWRFAVEEFGWKTSWSSENGFGITILDHSNITENIESETDAVTDVSNNITINGKSISFSGYKVDLNNDGIEVKTALAEDAVGSVDALGNIANSNNALLAINGSFFAAYNEDGLTKDPYGILIVDGVPVHNGNDRATIGFKDGKVDIDRVDANIKGSNGVPEWKYSWYGYWINHTVAENGVSLTIYDENRGAETYSEFGKNYIVDEGTIIDIVENQSVAIPKNGYVVNLNGVLGETPEQVYDRFKIGYTFSYGVTFTPENIKSQEFWTDLDYATGAGPALILDGGINIDFKTEHFTEAKISEYSASRSAIGYTGKNELILVTTTSTIQELAQIMLELGCYEAMNLDGGASSGLWYEGEYIRTPGREISNIIYIENTN